jgi:sulfoxide reductase catalytic subunit YedY
MTPEEIFVNRREFIKKAGLATIGLSSALMACRNDATHAQAVADPNLVIPDPAPGLYPADRNPEYLLERDRAITEESAAGSHNNFYEFANGSSHRDYVGAVSEVSKGYPFRPWKVELTGLCDNPVTLSIDEIEQVAPLEERLYRHRCVETWAMAVPWVGYSLSKLLDVARPKSEARYVRFTTFLDKKLPGIKAASWYPWPYYEGLRMDEARNELTMACTGSYGHALPPQHGAPIRIVVPWKYGYKSIKSIEKIEFVAEQPGTFWSELQPNEYPFESNVNPKVPHPRWSQAQEWMLGEGRFRKRDTKLYNGYGEYVAQLYA